VSVPVRDAATVMLIRDALDDRGAPAIEVCMLKRSPASEFVAGAYVFPGGSVDPDDRGPRSEHLCQGLTDAQASAVLGIESGGLAFWVAALRECFEEAGVMVARPRDHEPSERGRLLDTSDPEVFRRFAAHRDALNAGDVGLLEVCAQEGLVLAADAVHYVAHWITPELAPRRYDTRFFVTAAPPGQQARHDDGETVDTIWIGPADALARGRRGDIQLLPPTIACLAGIESFRSADQVMTWAAAIDHVVTVQPIVVVVDGAIDVLRPGDEGYEQAVADRAAGGAEGDAALVEAVRAAWGPKDGTR
jgi:8-oxo-dGTP pyrophosphatase MutT (NUDIX family)